jgi:hypothetical protein
MVESTAADRFTKLAKERLKEKQIGDWQVKLLNAESIGAQIFVE